MNDFWAMLTVLFRCDPRVSELLSIRECCCTLPSVIFTFFVSRDIEAHVTWCKTGQLITESIFESLELCVSSWEKNVFAKISSYVTISCLDCLPWEVLNVLCVGFEHEFWNTRPEMPLHVENGTVWKFVFHIFCFFVILNLIFRRDKANSFFDFADNLISFQLIFKSFIVLQKKSLEFPGKVSTCEISRLNSVWNDMSFKDWNYSSRTFPRLNN